METGLGQGSGSRQRRWAVCAYRRLAGARHSCVLRTNVSGRGTAKLSICRHRGISRKDKSVAKRATCSPQ